jgi:hypothetical protein
MFLLYGTFTIVQPCLLHRNLMSRLSVHVFYLWHHVLSIAPPFIIWWSNWEILFAPLHRSSPFIRELRCQAIQTEHGPYMTERTLKAVYIVRCLWSFVTPFYTSTFHGVVAKAEFSSKIIFAIHFSILLAFEHPITCWKLHCYKIGRTKKCQKPAASLKNQAEILKGQSHKKVGKMRVESDSLGPN